MKMLDLANLAARVLLVASCVSAAHAQDFPAKPVRIVVTFAPGGANDAATRLLAEKATEIWGRQVIVDFRGGAAGNIAAQHVAKSPADGYTVLLIGGSYFTNPVTQRNLPFDPVKDLVGITPSASSGMLLVANGSLPVRSLQDLIALARKNPGKLTYGSSGTGGSLHLSGEMLDILARIKTVHVPYKGGGPALIDVMVGYVDMMWTGVAATVPHIKTGRLRPIATASAARNPTLPDVPTVIESGVQGFEVYAHNGLLAPGGTPRDIIQRLNATFVRALQMPDTKEKYRRLGIDAISSSAEDYDKYIRAEIAKWQKVVTAIGLKPTD